LSVDAEFAILLSPLHADSLLTTCPLGIHGSNSRHIVAPTLRPAGSR
jgi:hypothetical protein